MSDWKTGFLSDMVMDPITYGIVQPGDFRKDGVPLIRGKDYMQGWVGEGDLFRVDPDLHEKYKRSKVTKGDVLLSIAGYVGETAIVPEWIEEANITQTSARIRCDEGILSSKYLFYFLQSNEGREITKKFSKGSAQSGLNLADIGKFEVPVPPLPEQKKIAEILSVIDEVIASKRNKICSSELLKKALISRHVESTVHETEEVKLGDLLHSIDSGWSPDCLKRPPLSDGEWSVLKTTSVTWKGFDQQERKALPSNLSPKKELVVEADDILITRAGPADRTGVVAYAQKKANNTMISDKIIRLRCDKSIIEPRFLSIFLGTDYAQRQMLKGKVGMASSQTNISQQLLREMKIRFPALEDQRRISEIITELQKTINQIQKSIEQTEKLKQSISTDLLSGRRRVNI